MNVEDIFYAATKIASPAGRAKYLDKACGQDRRLREEVEALLAAHDQAASFLENGVKASPLAINAETQDSSCLATQPPPAHRPIAEGPGTIVGRYKLLQEIGEGGMGVVYMAEQEKPVRRRVALKIIKPGMDSAQVIARFEAERQALAMMDHPNIARVLDVGCTETGRPFFVMELVQGIPATKYCDDKELNTRERLELFVHICNAVQHAHQKGIIHRDLKPSNVLVTIYDGKPMPKIIDFGVAKALHQRLTEATMFTQFGAVVGTLEYMSPEQAEMDALGTDTRSDIYSLGVLLYELLTGTTPMDGKQLRSLAYAEMLKTIREVDPPKPSTRLSQSRQDMANISARRHTEPRRLQKLIAGDLDWIVMKCLEKDRTRRYETANGLAKDIERHMNDEAVTASPPGSFYKIQKLVRRNKLAFAAVGCVILALTIGLVASLWQAGRAQREADRAKAALNELRAVARSIAAEARVLAAKEKFDLAIEKLTYASQLQPDSADYFLHKADLLETQFRLSDAAAVYRAALKLKPDDVRAKENAELCEQLAAATRSSDGKLSRESLSRLNAQMLKDQRPAAEIMPVARLLGDEKKYIVNYWLERLKDLPNGTDKPLEKRLTVRADGLLELDLDDTQVADLAPLAGMPLGALHIQGCKQVTDLSPLREMHLIRLYVGGTGVSSLEPLRGMSSLQALYIFDTKVSDLLPLAGMPLQRLEFDRCPVTSLAPLRGMPLERLTCRNTAITDLSPLAGMPLKSLDVSEDAVTDFTPLTKLPLEICFLQGTRVGDLAFLREMPLKQLALAGALGVRNLAVLSEIRTLEVLALAEEDLRFMSAKDFGAIEKLRDHPSLKQLTASIPIAVSLSNVPSKDEFWKNWDRDHAWALRLRKAGFSFSRGRRDNGNWWLTIDRHQSISDLSILAGARLEEITISYNNKISDLTPLKGLPLVSLNVAADPVKDLTPLRGLKLSRLSINDTLVQDLTPLQGMPLEHLDLRRCNRLTDLTPVASNPTLKWLLLPIQATDLEPFRKLPNLKTLSFTFVQRGDGTWMAACTAEAFWKTWDGLPWARKLEAAGIAFDVEQMEDGYYNVEVHDTKFNDCSIFIGSSVRGLTLNRTGLVDLRPLADLPLVSLIAIETKVKDLSVLRSTVLSKSLRTLRVSITDSVTDFSPVAACADLESLDLYQTPLADLSILKGMKLRRLIVGRTAVSDLAVVAGMPLDGIYLAESKVIDIAPLLKCPTLKSIILPADARAVTSLRALPRLERISYAGSGITADQTADQFWAKIKEEPWLDALRTAGLQPPTPKKLADGTWDLNLGNSAIRDLTPLNGAPISRLSLGHTAVTDLTPLRGMKLKRLAINETAVVDLEPLRGMPLEELFLSNTKVVDLSPLRGMPLKSLNLRSCTGLADISPLSECRSLTILTLPPKAKEIGFLRSFPNLKQLSYKANQVGAEEFWAEFDKPAPANQPAGAP